MKNTTTTAMQDKYPNWKKHFNIQLFAEDPQTNPPATDPNGGNDPKPAENTFTQEQVNAIVKDRLAKEKGKYTDYDEYKKAFDVAQLKQQEEMTELEKANKQIEDYKQKILDAENAKNQMQLEIAKTKLMNELGLDLKFADRVKGSNEEELKADIEAFKGMVGTVKTNLGTSFNPANANTSDKNPFTKEHFNLTEQGKLWKENPTLAQQLMQASK